MASKRIGYFTPYLPVELLWACGFSPVRLRPGRGHAAADGRLPRNFSVEARCLLAAALEQRLDAGAVVFLDEDDTSRRACDVWRAFAGMPVFGPVAVPRLAGPASAERYAGALAALAGELAALSGQPLTDESLQQAIDLYNRQRALWLALRQRWLEGGLATGEWHALRWLALTAEVESANEALAARLQTGPGPSAAAPAGPRLLVLGAMEVPAPLLALLEAGGARVVAEDSEAEERTLTEQVPSSGRGPLLDLAGAYLAKMPGPRAAELPRRLAALDRLVDERHVQGAIALYPKFADSYLAEWVALGEMFRARGLPALLLEDDGEPGPSGQQRTRVEAFLEILA